SFASPRLTDKGLLAPAEGSTTFRRRRQPRERGVVDMTRTANARIAGFRYLFYAAIGICLEILTHRARSVDGDSAAKLARIGEHATDVRIAILITLLECVSALVLAVTLYGITRDQDRELAMLALVCRVAEGVLDPLSI